MNFTHHQCCFPASNVVYSRLNGLGSEGYVMSEDAVRAKKGPFGVVVKKGQTYWWCACGRSKSQPFCDGSHKGTSFEPIKYVADDNVMVAFCGCKQSRTKPYCDDSHIAIEVGEEEIDESKKPRLF